MKTEILLTGASLLCAIAVPLTCVTSPPVMEASAAQEDTTVAVVPLAPVIDAVSAAEAIEKKPDCDVVIGSMEDKSSNIDEGMSEIKKDLEELKKRKKIKKVTKKKIKKKKVIDK